MFSPSSNLRSTVRLLFFHEMRLKLNEYQCYLLKEPQSYTRELRHIANAEGTNSLNEDVQSVLHSVNKSASGNVSNLFSVKIINLKDFPYEFSASFKLVSMKTRSGAPVLCRCSCRVAATKICPPKLHFNSATLPPRNRKWRRARFGFRHRQRTASE